MPGSRTGTTPNSTVARFSSPWWSNFTTSRYSMRHCQASSPHMTVRFQLLTYRSFSLTMKSRPSDSRNL